MSFCRVRPVRVLLLLLLPLAGCASADTQYARHLEQLGFSNADRVDQKTLFRRIGAEPTNARLHYENGLYLLARGRYSDLEVAQIAFANASRLAADWWLPEFGRAITEYRLGRYDAALAAFAEAIERRGSCGGLCYGFALAAFRGGHFGLAAQALAAAERAGPPEKPAERQAAEFLKRALADGPGARPAEPLRQRLQAAAARTAPGNPNISIDAFIIRQNRNSASSQGINLLDALQLQFGSTLINLTHSNETGEPATTTRSQSLEVNIPTINYALNIASEDADMFSIEASPSVVAVPGQTSRFFGGSNVLILAHSENSSESVERDIGMDLKVTPSEITEDYVDLEAVMELTYLTGDITGGGGIVIVQTEKTAAEAAAKIPFGRAIALGSGASTISRSGENGVPGIRKVPGAGNLFGVRGASVSRNDVLVLITVRRPSADTVSGIDENALSSQLFGVPAAPVARVSRLPSEVPPVNFLDWL